MARPIYDLTRPTLCSTGTTEQLAVVIATGHAVTTPRLLVSANIHGNEVNGLVVAHRLIATLEQAALAIGRGVIKCRPQAKRSQRYIRSRS